MSAPPRPPRRSRAAALSVLDRARGDLRRTVPVDAPGTLARWAAWAHTLGHRRAGGMGPTMVRWPGRPLRRRNGARARDAR
jgi:hypothetical protein